MPGRVELVRRSTRESRPSASPVSRRPRCTSRSAASMKSPRRACPRRRASASSTSPRQRPSRAHPRRAGPAPCRTSWPTPRRRRPFRIRDRRSSWCGDSMRPDCVDHALHREEMQRRIEQRERRALAGRVDRRPARQLAPPFDIPRRERSNRFQQLGPAERAAMSLIERFEPLSTFSTKNLSPLTRSPRSGTEISEFQVRKAFLIPCPPCLLRVPRGVSRDSRYGSTSSTSAFPG